MPGTLFRGFGGPSPAFNDSMMKIESTPSQVPWDPERIIQLNNPDGYGRTCIGYAVTQGRRCHRAVSESRHQMSRRQMSIMAAQAPNADAFVNELHEIAVESVCNWHRGPSHIDSYIQRWQQQIRVFAQTGKYPGGSSSKSNTAFAPAVVTYIPAAPAVGPDEIVMPKNVFREATETITQLTSEVTTLQKEQAELKAKNRKIAREAKATLLAALDAAEAQEKTRAEQEERRAEQEKIRAEEEEWRAEQEERKAEQEKTRAEQEKTRAEAEKQSLARVKVELEADRSTLSSEADQAQDLRRELVSERLVLQEQSRNLRKSAVHLKKQKDILDSERSVLSSERKSLSAARSSLATDRDANTTDRRKLNVYRDALGAQRRADAAELDRAVAACHQDLARYRAAETERADKRVAAVEAAADRRIARVVAHCDLEVRAHLERKGRLQRDWLDGVRAETTKMWTLKAPLSRKDVVKTKHLHDIPAWADGELDGLRASLPLALEALAREDEAAVAVADPDEAEVPLVVKRESLVEVAQQSVAQEGAASEASTASPRAESSALVPA